LAEAVAVVMSAYGTVELRYITAEFEPFSSHDRPDVTFVPYSGPNAGTLFVVELRLRADRELPVTKALAEHREFIQADHEEHVYFGVAYHGPISDQKVAELAMEQIHALGAIDSPAALVDQVVAWATAAVLPPWVDPK